MAENSGACGVIHTLGELCTSLGLYDLLRMLTFTPLESLAKGGLDLHRK